MVIRRILRAIATLGLLASVALLCLPFVRDELFFVRADQSVMTVVSQAGQLTDAALAATLSQAQSYNAWLGGYGENATVSQDQMWPYEQQLVSRDGLMMAYVEVEKLDTVLPIYHGTSEEALMAGIGHVEGSSLPVGGASAHCVLSGHSGMRNAQAFDGLGALGKGDTFVVWTLGTPYAYRVYDTETVAPEDVSSLSVAKGRDLCTLVTCADAEGSWRRTNEYRLLVHGERCAYEGQTTASKTAHQEATTRNVNKRLVRMGGLTAALFAAAVLAILRAWHVDT